MRRHPPAARVLAALLPMAACANEQRFVRIPEAPEVTIVTPSADQVLRQGEGALAFAGTADDEFDPPRRLDAVWILDGGEPSAAPVADDHSAALTLDADPLPLGAHHLELVVTDRDGDVGIAAVNWTLLGALEPPEVLITTPVAGATFVAGDDISFRGRASDNNTDPDELSFEWVSDADGILEGAISSDGESVLFATGLSVGTHAVTLTVTDVDGLTAADQVVIEVDEPLDGLPVVEAQVGDVIFSEILVNPEVVDDADGEWIEVYNTSSFPIDLDGYLLQDLHLDSYTLVGPIVVSPLDFAVLCANTDLLLNGGIPCDGWFNRTTYGGLGAYALGNITDEVLLLRPDGTIIDEVVYDSTWFIAATAKGLHPDYLNYLNNDDESNWCHQETVLATGGEPGTPGVMNDGC